MALERIGLGAVFTTNSKPMVSGVRQARNAYSRFVNTANTVPPSLARVAAAMSAVAARARAMGAAVLAGMRKIGAGIGQLAMGLAPFSIVLGIGIKKAADFEKQMSAVGAVSRASAKDMDLMAAEAKRMGIVSAFSATQSAEGMEFLARAGAKPTQIVAGLSGVMNAAAADGIELAQSADIVARVVKGMGMEWSEAAHIADTLAMASASSNTNILALGESFVYGVSAAKSLGVGLEETTAIFGKLADAGLKGSLGGTAFMNMMAKISAPTGKATTMLKKWGVKMTEADGSLRKISDITQDVSKHINKMKNVTDRAAAAKEIFGMRGMRAYNALATAGKDAIDELESTLVKSSDGIGAAQEMADRRLDNLSGRLTLFASSMEGLFSAIFGPALAGFQKSIRQMTDALNQVLFALQDFDKLGPEAIGASGEMMDKYGSNTIQVAQGIRDAIKWIQDAWKSVTDSVKSFTNMLEEKLGGQGIRTLTKMIIVFTVAAGALAPILLGVMLAGFAFSGLASIIGGIWTIASAVFWPLLAVLAVVVTAVSLLKKENETFGQAALRLWGMAKAAVVDFYENAILPFIEGFKEAWEPVIKGIGETWNEVIMQMKAAYTEFMELSGLGASEMSVDWKEVGKVVAVVIGVAADIVLGFVKTIVQAFQWVIRTVHNVAAALGTMFGGDITGGLKRLGLAIADFVIQPLQGLIKWVIKAADAIGASDLIPESVKEFAKTKEFGGKGLTGFFFPEGEKAKPKIKGPAEAKKKKIDNKLADEFMAEYGIMPADIAQGQTQDVTSMAAEQALKMKALEKADREKQGRDLTEAMNKLANKKTDIAIDNKMCVDGEALTVASAKHQTKVKERSGGMPQWQRGPMHDYGVARTG